VRELGSKQKSTRKSDFSDFLNPEEIKEIKKKIWLRLLKKSKG
jgi:hypothetical protein